MDIDLEFSASRAVTQSPLLIISQDKSQTVWYLMFRGNHGVEYLIEDDETALVDSAVVKAHTHLRQHLQGYQLAAHEIITQRKAL